jgi:hypothetical protein
MASLSIYGVDPVSVVIALLRRLTVVVASIRLAAEIIL